jgi:hypothetical protein
MFAMMIVVGNQIKLLFVVVGLFVFSCKQPCYVLARLCISEQDIQTTHALSRAARNIVHFYVARPYASHAVTERCH